MEQIDGEFWLRVLPDSVTPTELICWALVDSLIQAKAGNPNTLQLGFYIRSCP